MRKKITLAALLCSLTIYAQVGINTTSPKATFDVMSKTTDGSKPEGLIAPRLTGDQIQAADAQYDLPQKGAIVYVTSIPTASSAKTANIIAEGYYFFDGYIWKSIADRTPNIIIKENQTTDLTILAAELTSLNNSIILQGTGTPINIYMPKLTMADKGKSLSLSCSVFSGINPTVTYLSPIGDQSYTLMNGRGRNFLWDGKAWSPISY